MEFRMALAWPGTFLLTNGHLDPVALPPQEPTGLSAEARSSDFESRLSESLRLSDQNLSLHSLQILCWQRPSMAPEFV